MLSRRDPKYILLHYPTIKLTEATNPTLAYDSTVDHTLSERNFPSLPLLRKKKNAGQGVEQLQGELSGILQVILFEQQRYVGDS